MKTLDSGYYHLEQSIRSARPDGMLFTTDARGVFEAYLNAIPVRQRQVYNCRCCRRFLEKYGTLVTIDAEGRTQPAFIRASGGGSAFAKATQAIYEIVSAAKVTGVFYSSERVLGEPESGGWSHLHARNPNVATPTSIYTLDQIAAQKREDMGMLERAVAEYSIDNARDAVRVLEADVVRGSEKALHIAMWFLNVHSVIRPIRSKQRRRNLLWYFAAEAPAGYCHIKTTMIHTLMDDVKSGLPLEAIRRKWNEKMDPMQYRRPTTVKAGNITRANSIFEALRADNALERRFASPPDVTHKLWSPRARRPFDKLMGTSPILGTRRIPVDSLRSVILPNACSIEVMIPGGNAPFFGLTAPVHPRSRNLFQWNNGIGWYFYNGGSPASAWGLKAGSFATVSAAIQKPCHWGGAMEQQSDPTLFVINGMRDRRYVKGGLFFPEFLRSEYHEVRSSIEAYSNNSTLANVSVPVCGIEAVPGLTIRVNQQDVYFLE